MLTTDNDDDFDFSTIISPIKISNKNNESFNLINFDDSICSSDNNNVQNSDNSQKNNENLVKDDDLDDLLEVSNAVESEDFW
jgi:hypothetical protein